MSWINLHDIIIGEYYQKHPKMQDLTYTWFAKSKVL